jgi:hypothetical protein
LSSTTQATQLLSETRLKSINLKFMGDDQMIIEQDSPLLTALSDARELRHLTLEVNGALPLPIIQNLSSLSIVNSTVYSLSGIETMKRLRSLELERIQLPEQNSNSLAQFSALAQVTSLRTLRIKSITPKSSTVLHDVF